MRRVSYLMPGQVCQWYHNVHCHLAPDGLSCFGPIQPGRPVRAARGQHDCARYPTVAPVLHWDCLARSSFCSLPCFFLTIAHHTRNNALFAPLNPHSVPTQIPLLFGSSTLPEPLASDSKGYLIEQ